MKAKAYCILFTTLIINAPTDDFTICRYLYKLTLQGQANIDILLMKPFVSTGRPLCGVKFSLRRSYGTPSTIVEEQKGRDEDTAVVL